MFMRVIHQKKQEKIPRNFRLHPEINEQLKARGRTFKDGDRIGETGVVEAALEYYFSRHGVSKPAPESQPFALNESSQPPSSGPEHTARNAAKPVPPAMERAIVYELGAQKAKSKKPGKYRK
jgi:hypothetical protein